MGQQRLWTQTIQIKDPAPRPDQFTDRQVVIDYDHDPDTDVFTLDVSGAVISWGAANDAGIAIRHLVANHPKIVRDRFSNIVPATYHTMYGSTTEDMERAVMQYTGYHRAGAVDFGWGPAGHISLSQGASGVATVTGTTTGTPPTHSHGVTPDPYRDGVIVTTDTSGTNPGAHSHTVFIPSSSSGTGTNLPNSQQVLFPPEQLTEDPAWEDALSLVVEDITNVYGESEEGSSMETLAAALLDTIRLFKERL